MYDSLQSKDLLQIWDLSDKDLFWQYPVITEKQVMESLKSLKNRHCLSRQYVYLAIPWATIIDRNIYLKSGLESQLVALIDKIFSMQKKMDPSVVYITCCQHIYFKRVLSVLKLIKVSILFASHKTTSLKETDGIKLMPLQLFAVNVEDPARNRGFDTVDFNLVERPYLYSFTGYYSKNYLTPVRRHLFEMRHPINCLMECTKKWHFVDTVYREQAKIYKDVAKPVEIDNVERYNKLLLRSRFSLCPSGTGPNSIRLWESMAIGAIPVILSDTLDLPAIPNPNYQWSDTVVWIKEKEVKSLSKILGQIDSYRETLLRKNCLEVYKLFSGKNFALHIYNFLNIQR